MSKVKELEKAIDALPEEEYIQLRQWFSEKDWHKWDQQIEADSKAGRLDSIVPKAPVRRSPFDVSGLRKNISRKEIIEAIHESRKQA